MHLQGISASPGVVHGRAVLFTRPELPVITGPGAGIEFERARLSQAVKAAVLELVNLKEKTRAHLGDEYAHILRSQQTIAEDECILGEVEEILRESSVCAEEALRTVFDNYRSLFAELNDDDYNKGRAADIEDVYKRILRQLLGVGEINLSNLAPNSIIVAEELYPSDTVLMDTGQVDGIVTERGGPTSHVAILAKNLGIAAAVRVGNALASIRENDVLVLDTADIDEARVFVNPDARTRHQLVVRGEELARHRDRVARYRGEPAVTPDGFSIELSANVGSTAELDPAVTAGAGSIGLYRSEFLFLNSAVLPDEDVQYEAYRRAAETFREGSVIVRTLDVGGDKQLPSITLGREDNPFLGNRALRLSLSRPMLFRTQLRAILRASAVGNVKLMFPMVGGIPELAEALKAVERVKAELRAEGEEYDADIEIGIMVEIPSAVWVADALASRVSFFSVGTNDLTQYLMAADRLNGDVEQYYRAFDPSVFRAIRQVVTAAEQRERWVGVCGELGGSPLAIPALIGLGVTELSMSPSSLAEATWLIRTTPMKEARNLAESVLSLDSHTEIKALLEEFYAAKE
ncbi:MAG: phosphoenolpyruvate--protein phosphotransferase [Alkalispirochaeta sp.]